MAPAKGGGVKRAALLLTILLVSCSPTTAQTLPRWTTHTTLTALLGAEKDRIAALPVNSFKSLTDTEVFAAGDALAALMQGSLSGLPTLQAMGYIAYTFDPLNGKHYYLLREPSGTAFRGLGLIVVDRAPTFNLVIHAKHIPTDQKSHITSRMFFEELGATMLVWTGVRRCDSTTISQCMNTTVKNNVCGGIGERISDASRYNRNVMTAATLAGVQRGAVTIDIHSNSSEVRQVMMSTGGPTLASMPVTFFPNRIRDRILATSGLTVGSCDYPGEPVDTFSYCSRFIQQKVCNGLSPQEACGPMLPAETTGRYVQIELRDTVYSSTLNTRAVINAVRAELLLP